MISVSLLIKRPFLNFQILKMQSSQKIFKAKNMELLNQ